ncbi:dethiobiotin synthase (plasmid) [Agrobacterium rosae]|uniref:ATP-dependent dethiobiotin synthetase BioD n=1 Tax=Agrobacterium rosae TaxID=1972867 RepID=A0ABU4W214_9HYPH|nr:dethiobiotin synthase [Agrobacterium rosae]MDX8331818.1 dethiobiotin synthase [Agrobacterium rosae]
MIRVVVTGTDTGIGKTIFSAALTAALGGYYWKPVQSGLEDETDSQTVQRLARLTNDRILPEAYRLQTPASPHLAAKRDHIVIAPELLTLPVTDAPLIIEGAGGLLVPLTDTEVFADVFRRWQTPVILCAGTGLGTINHTLLSLEALRSRSIPVKGVAFIGDEHAETQRIIAIMGQVPILGRLPRLDPLTPEVLLQAFHDNFSLSSFQETLA